MTLENDGNNKDNDRGVCKEHSGVCKDVLNISNAVAASTGNITRLFEKFELLAEKFQDKFEALSKDFQDKFLQLAQRPGWMVCIVMSTMSGIIGVLVTFILYAHFAGKV